MGAPLGARSCSGMCLCQQNGSFPQPCTGQITARGMSAWRLPLCCCQSQSGSFPLHPFLLGVWLCRKLAVLSPVPASTSCLGGDLYPFSLLLLLRARDCRQTQVPVLRHAVLGSRRDSVGEGSGKRAQGMRPTQKALLQICFRHSSLRLGSTAEGTLQ